MSIFSNLFGSNEKRINKMIPVVEEINRLEEKISKLSDGKIRDRINEIRKDISSKLEKEETKAEGDKSVQKTIINDIQKTYLPEAFALTREASKRTLGQRHFDVQLIGGMVLNEGNIAEMMTGEGKTLVATLPASLNALSGKGVHIITVNDYLARRDAGWMGQIYNFLGLSVGVIIHDQALIYDASYEEENAIDERTKHLRPVARKEAYMADILYGTNNEFGFDYLRDNMVQDLSQMVQRELNFSIVDEVDSILIDEARTPLIISAPAEESTGKYTEIDHLVKQLSESDYIVDEKANAVSLTDDGIAHMEKLLGVENIYEEFGIENVHHIEQALRANILFKKDKDYVIKDGEIVIVDEFTGRLMFGRRYSEGLHQAIEAKEGVEIKRESLTLATISFQNYFRLYTKLSGMTGTATTEAEEFSKIYELEVIAIPSNKGNIRSDMSDMIYKTERGKFLAITEEIKERNKKGQPVLVGTVSIEKNELLSDLLKRNGVKHEVLNAKNHEREAMIIEKAGQKGAVTVATNMAGRGTDIVLDDKAKELGGLHVIGTERHESRRIDNQLRGRCGRQGDPGSTQFFVSLEDDLMRIFGSDRVRSIMDKLGLEEDQPIQHSMITKSLESAQRRVEGHNFDIRKHLVEYDDVMNKQRSYIYKMRKNVLENKSLKEDVLGVLEDEIGLLVDKNIDIQTNDVLVDETVTSFETLTGVRTDIKNDLKNQSAEKVKGILFDIAKRVYEDKESRIGDELMRILEKAVYLRTIDMLWIDHLDAMNHLREGIGLRAYAQKDSLVEYKNESYQMFRSLLTAIDAEVSGLVFRAEITPEKKQETELTKAASKATPQEKEATAREKRAVVKRDKVGRNDLCPCGSGKKYKKCCGK
jgi:preprotein translocase subunit SecA